MYVYVHDVASKYEVAKYTNDQEKKRYCLCDRGD